MQAEHQVAVVFTLFQIGKYIRIKSYRAEGNVYKQTFEYKIIPQ